MEDTETEKDRGGVVQFFRDYWTLINQDRRRIFFAASVISMMQALAIAEPSIITSMVQDALRMGVQAKRVIAWKLGKPNATREEIIAAAKLANIHTRVMSFAGQYDARVGNGGLQLSGGERQRIAIARVLLMDPSVIVFDEATSAVDAESDEAIHEAVDCLAKMGKTIIIIAHRLGTVRGADCIYCLEAGQVVESGAHDELLRRHGRYHALWTAHERGSRGRGHAAADSAN